MAFKVFFSETVIVIQDLDNPSKKYESLNPAITRYWVSANGNFFFKESTENTIYDVGPFDNVQNEFGESFASEDELRSYINSFVYVSPTGASAENPLPTSDIDNNNRLSRNTVFGDKITAKRIPQLAAQFQYPLQTSDIQPPDVGNGGTILQENSLLKLNTDAQLGSFANIQSQDTLRYIPGFECYLFLTPDFNNPISEQTQFVGVMDQETGFGFGYNGTDFVFLYRRDGVDQYFIIDLDNFEKTYGYRLNPQKGNTYLLSYGFLGYAPAKLEVMTPKGGFSKLYTFEYPNSNDQTHLNQTFLPLRGELNNNGGNTPMTLTIGSLNAGIVDGGADSLYTFSRSFNYFDSDLVVNGSTEIVGFRNKTSFGGRTNYVNARLFNFNVAQDLNKSSIVVLFRNPVLLNTPTWNDVDPESILEFSTDILVDFAQSDDTFYSQALFRLDSLDKLVEPFRFDLPPGAIAVFAILTTGQGDAAFSNFWKELF